MKKISIIIILLISYVASCAYADVSKADVANFCNTQKDLVCPSDIGKHLDYIDAYFVTTKKTLQKKPAGMIYDKIKQILVDTQTTQIDLIEELKMRYLREKLLIRKAEIEERLFSITFSSLTIRSLRSRAVEEKAFLQSMRQYVIGGLVAQGFTGFYTKPYISPNPLTRDGSGTLSVEPLTAKDGLDILLQRRRSTNKTKPANKIQFSLTPKERDRLGKLYLFKTKEDLAALGYDVVSSRSRVNKDASYRRHNIKTAFDQIGHIRVLLPNETISFLDASGYDPIQQKLYQYGKVISMDQEVDGYGGGLCGAVTAIYQGIVTNKGLEKTFKNHSKRYNSLYIATIDDQLIKTPGIDATVYSPNLDLKFTNTRTYPIVIVMNYTGAYNGIESVFTLSKPDDHGSIEFLSKRYWTSTIQTKEGPRSGNGACYLRNINGKEVNSCYKEVKG